ncbi:hypothetical protein NADFUDRAFT_47269 [Nadsonia fulvescens var. elongata DSM 6958]|uniref:Uncharacterized protein n=1 Tax=Nadsonia fulvescens var. elongata DSM 6958 TaxID=857566 RepID=A0A1E3PI81_9ASCO|nr:hypothetical protein NADFUDRAFT_47269 [Nadsonia fulvescens var. elongata DSM 6958]
MSINSNLKHGNQFSSDSTAARSPAASSMIFERSVQDNFLTGSPSFYNKKLLPSSFSPCTNHHTQEDFIPAVLDASTQALARNNVNPDNINVISARHPSAVPLSGPGSPVTAHGNNEFSGTPFSNGNPLSRNRTNSINNTFSALSRNSSGTNLTTVRNTLSNSGLSSPNNNSSNMHGFTPVISRLSRTNSIQTQNRIDRQDHYGEQSRENPEGETPSVLSFYSFADVIKTEGASSTSPKTTTNHASFDSSNTAPSDGGPICRHMSTSSNYIPHTALFTKHQLASHPSNGNGDNDNCAFSFQDNESDDTDDGLHMSSLGDTLRKCSISCAER